MWRSQAEAEGLTLLKAENKTGYFGVYHSKPGRPKPYKAEIKQGGKQHCLGTFTTAAEAALAYARRLGPAGCAAAAAAAPAPPPAAATAAPAVKTEEVPQSHEKSSLPRTPSRRPFPTWRQLQFSAMTRRLIATSSCISEMGCVCMADHPLPPLFSTPPVARRTRLA